MDAPTEEAVQEVPLEPKTEHRPTHDVEIVYLVLGIGMVILVAWIRIVEMAFRTV